MEALTTEKPVAEEHWLRRMKGAEVAKQHEKISLKRSYCWALKRTERNRTIHALNGNIASQKGKASQKATLKEARAKVMTAGL